LLENVNQAVGNLPCRFFVKKPTRQSVLEYFSMIEITTDKQPAKQLDLPRLISMLLHPEKTFSEMSSESRGTWLTPMLVLSISGILAVIVSGYLNARNTFIGEAPLPPDWEFWTPEAQESFLQAQQTTQGPLFTYILPILGVLLSLWLGWIIFSGILRLASTLLGGRGTMQSALNVVAWASLPFVVRDLLRIVFMFLAGHVITSPGLSGFASDSGFMSSLLAQTDIFLFWNIALLVTGFAIFDGLPRGKALAGVLIIVLVILFTQAGLGALVSSFGATGVERSFF